MTLRKALADSLPGFIFSWAAEGHLSARLLIHLMAVNRYNPPLPTLTSHKVYQQIEAVLRLMSTDVFLSLVHLSGE